MKKKNTQDNLGAKFIYYYKQFLNYSKLKVRNAKGLYLFCVSGFSEKVIFESTVFLYVYSIALGM